MKAHIIPILALGLRVTGWATPALAVDDYHLLDQAMDAQRRDAPDQAIPLYHGYIRNHPLRASAPYSGQIKNQQYYLRNLLLAYTNLVDLQSEAGNTDGVATLTRELDQLYASGRLGSKNAYKVASIFVAHGRRRRGRDILLWIIEDQERIARPQNNKVVLRSYRALFRDYRETGDSNGIRTLLARLSRNYPSEFCDARDRYTLAGLLERHGSDSQPVTALLEEIVSEYLAGDDKRDLKVALAAIAKLAKIYSEAGDQAGLSVLVTKVSDSTRFDEISVADQYKLGSALLNYGRAPMGAELLRSVATHAPHTVEARKALFVLGRNALADHRWDDAEGHYATYIERYPNAGFFTLKAYSRLLDASFARDGYSDYLQAEMEAFAAIVSDIADYDVMLNLARDLKWKGQDKLAGSTFELAHKKTMDHIAEHPGGHRELRARWLLEKYAHALERDDLVEENGAAILALSERLLEENPTSKAAGKARYIRGQTHLWLAKTAQSSQDVAILQGHLEAFIADNPADPDIDYAWFQLAESYRGLGDHGSAEQGYRQVKKGVLKGKAEAALAGLPR